MICLPTFNEHESVGLMIDYILALNFPLIISDAGSTDGTQQIARGKGIEVYDRAEMGYGCDYGSGLIMAMNIAHGKGYKNLAFVDCDMSYPVARLPELVSYLSTNDIVTGARDFSKIRFSHRLANYLFTWLTNLLFRSDFKDVCSGMRAIRISSFLGQLHAKDMSFVIQMSVSAVKRKLIVKDVPVDYYDRVGTSKVTILDAVPILWQIIKQRFIKA